MVVRGSAGMIPPSMANGIVTVVGSVGADGSMQQTPHPSDGAPPQTPLPSAGTKHALLHARTAAGEQHDRQTLFGPAYSNRRVSFSPTTKTMDAIMK